MSARPLVLLFDIDGTLITSGGVGRAAMNQAFDDVCGRLDACDGFRMDGMTDRAIVRRGLTDIGRDVGEALIDRVMEAYLGRLAVAVREAEDAIYRVHRGVIEVLDAAARTSAAIGLGTGNVRRGADVKLARVGLHQRFAFGGFGCDHEDRAALIRRGAERGAALLGAELPRCRVVVIGDTPKDVSAALAMGAECVGVGTGRHTPQDLIASGATAAFPDLGAPGALEAVLYPQGMRAR